MNSQTHKNQRPEFIAGETSAEAIEKQFIETPMAAARQPAINIGLDLLAFMSSLPDAVIDSEQRELKRLSRTAEDKNDPRIERLKVSIERATTLRFTSQQGKARIDRALVSLSEEGNVFHGFVSDGNLKPKKGLTVRIAVARDGSKDTNSLSATTDADGYFSIPLSEGKTDERKQTTHGSTVNLSEQMAERLASMNAKAKAKTETGAGADQSYVAAGDRAEILARVEILDAAKNVIHPDSSPLVVNAGTAYREYVIADDETGKSYASDTITGVKPAKENTSAVKPAATAKPSANSPAPTQKATPASKKKAPGKTKK